MTPLSTADKTTAFLRSISETFRSCEPVERVVAGLAQMPPERITVTGLSGSSIAFLIDALRSRTHRPILVVSQRSEEASDIYDDLSFLMDAETVGHFPSRQILPYDFRAPVGEIMGRRISTLAGLTRGEVSVVVCPVRALIEPTITVANLQDSSLLLKTGDEVDLDNLVGRLVRLGFRRVPVVEEVGDFALRGGLIDFFSPGSDTPVRIELFGDEIETIRQFDTGSQRTIGRVDNISILPKREIPITQESLEKHLESLSEDDADQIRRRYINDPELPGLEWLSIMFGISQGALADYLPENCIVLFDGKGSLETECESILSEAQSLYDRIRNRFEKLPIPEQYYHDSEKTFAKLQTRHSIDRVPFKGARKDVIDFDCKPHPSFNSRLDLLGDEIKDYQHSAIEFFIATDTDGQAMRLGDLIAEKSGLDEAPPIEVADLKGGFVSRHGRFAVLTDHEIFSRHHRRIKKKRYKEGVAISDYSSLETGDFVVHTDYGIARYLGLKTITVDDRNRDCLLLQYAGEDRLYVPIEEFNRVSKYAGKDTAPVLTGLGGPAWEKLKARTKKAIADMAEELLKLYASRKAAPGFSYGEDTTWLKQLEASFIYEETPDQLKAIEHVKADLTREQPMDRLICGDVGYGKTEVAVRAAFKVIDRGHQVAVLVPTTILAQQHLQTFTDRLRDFPVRIDMLSRFRTRKEQLQTVEDLAAGKVDLVIGTHRLLSKDIQFKNLGLLVVDEEHRFGVRNKEKLRQLRADVDTLSMTATPIPRTLQMSLMGARDMSLINTSPKDRLPIVTEIVEFDPAIIATTILREVDRGGQVFFVHNRVQSIDSMYHYLKKLLPQVEIAVAHGQMHEKSLEGIMLGFMMKRFDVLLCTSIIESGLDIPSANTIIINRADRFGLAQLYQMRGRVGRSSRQAYAYLIAPSPKILRADAIKRLRALEAHADLGSGFALAMRDLEIRGAGTILGSRQSGFIEQIGYDLYNKLLEEAVAELKGQPMQRLPETKIELDAEYFLPDQYINDRQQKVDIYRRLADSRTLADVEKLRDEITDRFGKMPQQATNLVEAAAVKVLAALKQVEKVSMKRAKVNIFFAEERTITRAEVEAFRKATDQPLEFSLTGRSQVILNLMQIKESDRLAYLRGVMAKI